MPRPASDVVVAESDQVLVEADQIVPTRRGHLGKRGEGGHDRILPGLGFLGFGHVELPAVRCFLADDSHRT